MADSDKVLLQELTHKWRNSTLTEEEKRRSDRWLNVVSNKLLKINSFASSDAEMEAELFRKIQEQILPAAKHRRIWPRVAAAASISLIISAGSYFTFHKQVPRQTAQNQVHDMTPVNTKPMLILENGQNIVLQNTKAGQIAWKGTVAINQILVLHLVYTKVNTITEAPYNTLTNARGSKVISLT